MTRFMDVGDLEEDKRIDMIVHQARDHKKVVAFITDDIPDKPERYIRKIKEKYPEVVVFDRFKGPVENTVTIKVGPPEKGAN